ncbi:MAG TPA: hypothetical protein VK463_17990, partial [Desulfomonilaceae bacterium]|nr:hypothetical protein [Desulfomonilaceae bacterium]
DFRIGEMMEYFDLMKEAFRFPELYDKNSKPVEIAEEVLQKAFQKKIDKQFPGIGVNVDFFSIPPRNRDRNTVRFEIHSGTHPDEVFIDSYDISIGEARKVPDVEYFEKSIEIFKPFEAYLSEIKNESLLNAYDRQQVLLKFDKPAIIRGFHYLDEGMARSIGGIDYCLKAPAWNVKRLCKGVLIELVPGLFDTSNPEHLGVQEETMAYFDML